MLLQVFIYFVCVGVLMGMCGLCAHMYEGVFTRVCVEASKGTRCQVSYLAP